MPPQPDPGALQRYVDEAAAALGVPLEPAWRPMVAEHLRRLLEASETIEASGLCGAEPVTRFEP